MPIASSDISTKVINYSGAPIDKIVGVWTGSFDKSTDVTTRTGGAGSINVYPIDHGLTRPLFLSYSWSEDGATWVDGGGTLPGGNSSIAFSDSDNIYLVASSGAGTQYYRVIGYWIDSYDNTDPAVEAYASTTKNTKYDSRVNYQKIFLEGESSYPAGTVGSAYTVSITHDLGYKPNAKAFFEPIGGEVWPLNSGGAANPFYYSLTQDEGLMQIYSDRVDVTVTRFSNEVRRVWYKVYYDA